MWIPRINHTNSYSYSYQFARRVYKEASYYSLQHWINSQYQRKGSDFQNRIINWFPCSHEVHFICSSHHHCSSMLCRTFLFSENSTICSKPHYHCSTHPTLTFLQRLCNWQANPQETDRRNQSCNLLSRSAKCFIMACKQVISKVHACIRKIPVNSYRLNWA